MDVGVRHHLSCGLPIRCGDRLEALYVLAVTTHLFEPLLKRAGLPQARFHDLSSYLHVLPAMQECAARAMEEALS